MLVDLLTFLLDYDLSFGCYCLEALLEEHSLGLQGRGQHRRVFLVQTGHFFVKHCQGGDVFLGSPVIRDATPCPPSLDHGCLCPAQVVVIGLERLAGFDLNQFAVHVVRDQSVHEVFLQTSIVN